MSVSPSSLAGPRSVAVDDALQQDRPKPIYVVAASFAGLVIAFAKSPVGLPSRMGRWFKEIPMTTPEHRRSLAEAIVDTVREL